MFGGCSLTYKDKTIDSKKIHSKRIWTLLECLITYRNKKISQNDLIELLYPEDKSETPLSALKTLVHRARAVLDELNYMDSKSIILQCSGGYIWNPDIPLVIDTEDFENTIKKADLIDTDVNTKLHLLLASLDLYKGDFLPDSIMETWALSINAYYRFLYMDTVKLALRLLSESNKFNDVISVAQKAITIDPYEESLYYHLIIALANTNQVNMARSQYEKMTKLFYSKFGVTPSKELQSVYKMLLKSDNGVEKDLGIIKIQMLDEENIRGAFCCEYEVFKDMYRVEARSAARKGRPVHVCLMNVNGREGKTLSKKTQNVIMQKLSNCIQSSLRSGDVYSRYSISQYIILLPSTTFENGEMVLERIVKKFRQDNPRSLAAINYSLQAIDVVMQVHNGLEII